MGVPLGSLSRSPGLKALASMCVLSHIVLSVCITYYARDRERSYKTEL